MGLSCRYTIFLSCLGCSSRPKYTILVDLSRRPAGWVGSHVGSPVSKYVSLGYIAIGSIIFLYTIVRHLMASFLSTVYNLVITNIWDIRYYKNKTITPHQYYISYDTQYYTDSAWINSGTVQYYSIWTNGPIVCQPCSLWSRCMSNQPLKL